MTDPPNIRYGEVIDNEYVICPFCGYKIEGWDISFESDESQTLTCDECGEQFIATRSEIVTYSTTGIIGTKECFGCKGTGKSPVLQRNCSLCKGTGKLLKTMEDQWLEDYKARNKGDHND